MAIDQKKYEQGLDTYLRDTRPLWVRIADSMTNPGASAATFVMLAASFHLTEYAVYWADVIFILGMLYFWFLYTRDKSLAFKLPMTAKFKDMNNDGPGKNHKPEGICYLGNVDKTNEEVWFTNSDIRTHILYLGTTGAGKTEGLKSLVSNAMCWGSGFVYVDGKADTDLWSSLSSLVRRFGRDDDLLVLNYMTGNSDVKAPSNTMNPFSSGSASYLTNMLVSLMPEASGDNVMWKERAVSLVASIMPALTWKRDNQDMPMNIGSIRKYLILNQIIALSRDTSLPPKVQEGVKGYLDTLPGYVDDAFDDNGQVKPPGPNQPQVNTEVPFQQHGYLSMQLTRALQSLGDEYGYIFDAAAADVDMMDVVLNRRILVVLIPALEKSSDEIANLGKIVAAALKGMMGSTLGTSVEGESSTVIENKPTHSATPFMTVFDEVGYYTAEGMAVMAAQARSLGFCLVYAAQDLPALEKRVKEEARSITANCNVKLFGKLEDPTQTKEFFENTVGQAIVTEVQGFQTSGGLGQSYFDSKQAGTQLRPRATYDGLKKFKEGQAVCTFGEKVTDIRVFYSNPGFAKAMRVTRFIGLPPIDEAVTKHTAQITKLRDRLVKRNWSAEKAEVDPEVAEELKALKKGVKRGKDAVESGILGLIAVHALSGDISTDKAQSGSAGPKVVKKPAQKQASQTKAPPAAAQKPAQPPPDTKQQAATQPQTQTQSQSQAQSQSQSGSQGQVQAQAQNQATKTAQPPVGADDGNPMSFFGAKKTEEGEESSAPPPSEPPARTQPQSEDRAAAQQATQEAAAVEISDDGNPMSFFGAKKPAAQSPKAQSQSAPVQPAAQSQTESQAQSQAGEQVQQTQQTQQALDKTKTDVSPVQTDTAITQAQPADQNAQNSQPANLKEMSGQSKSQKAEERLGDGAANIIKDAAGNMRKSVFKADKEDITEAAE